MKKSYIKILIFEIFSFILMIVSSFKSSILNIYQIPFFLLILNFIFILLLGYEKNNKRYEKDVIFEIIRSIVLILLIYYLFGIIFTFAKMTNYLNLYGITKIIIPLILVIIFKEILRYLIITKCGDNKLLICLTVIYFVGIDVLNPFFMINKMSAYSVFIFISCNLLPAISTNILLTYLTRKVGWKPSLIYLLLTSLYMYILPIIPNPSKYLKCIIDLIIPIILLLRVIKVVKTPFSEVLNSRNLKKESVLGYIFPTLIMTIAVYFVSGYFKYYVIAVASGSMHPVFDRGDVVVVEQVNDKYYDVNKLSVGDVIAFRTKSNIVVVHRIVKIMKYEDEKYFYTKGDANDSIDDNILVSKDVIGIVRNKIPFIGYPTVIFSEL